jgi:gelsolin
MEDLFLNMNEEGNIGEIQGWVIEGHDGRALESEELGHLVDSECYVFLHIFSHHGKDQVTIYYWIGAKSSNNKELIAANLVVDLDESLEEKGSHCRVVMNNETVHFLALFANGLVIHSGDAGIRNNPTHLYSLKGSTMYNAYIV